jgi:hypothetical protein
MESVFPITKLNRLFLLKAVSFSPAPMPSDAANCISSLRHYRSYMCCIPNLLSPEYPGQTTSKGGIMHSDGSGRYVGTLLDMTHHDLY